MQVLRRIVNVPVVCMFVDYYGRLTVRNVKIIHEQCTVGEKRMTPQFTECRD